METLIDNLNEYLKHTPKDKIISDWNDTIYMDLMLSGKLKQHLEKEWRFNNHSKYYKHFDLWYKNLTKNQIKSFCNLIVNSKI